MKNEKVRNGKKCSGQETGLENMGRLKDLKLDLNEHD